MTKQVSIFEVGPRDGLQNEAAQIATADKIRLVDMLSATGLKRLEVTSFVSPKWIPQMADGAKVLAGIDRNPGVSYSALTPNLQGFENAIAAGVDEVAVFASASETFSQRNINCSIAESLERFQPVFTAAGDAKIPVRGYISCIIDCPFEGEITPELVADLAVKMIENGCFEISLGDTIGHGTPARVDQLLASICARVSPQKLAGHFHDTKGYALDNIAVSLEHGLRIFDAAAGGLGGCPFAPGAAGNVATEAVAALLETKGFETGIDPVKLAEAGAFAKELKGGK